MKGALSCVPFLSERAYELLRADERISALYFWFCISYTFESCFSLMVLHTYTLFLTIVKTLYKSSTLSELHYMCTITCSRNRTKFGN